LKTAVKQNISTKPITPENWKRSMENDLHKLDIHGNSVAVVVDES
jgi:hypothetical protein